MRKRTKLATAILATIVVATLSACSTGGTNNSRIETSEATTQFTQQVEATKGLGHAADGFSQFKDALDNAGYPYEVVQMGAELVGAERGEKYKFDFGTVELYRFSSGADALTNGEIALEGFGSFPIEVSGQYGAIISVTANEDEIKEMFADLK